MNIKKIQLLGTHLSILVIFNISNAAAPRESLQALSHEAQIENLQDALSDCQYDLAITNLTVKQLRTMSAVYDEQIEALSAVNQEQAQRIQNLIKIATRYKAKAEQLKYEKEELSTAIDHINRLIKQLVELLADSGVYDTLKALETNKTRSALRPRIKSGTKIKQTIDNLYQEIAETVLKTYNHAAAD